MTAIGIGVACGLIAAAISEALLRLILRFRELDPIRVSLTGALLRGSWVLICLTLGASQLGAGFAVALLGAYLAAQVGEGLRFERALRK